MPEHVYKILDIVGSSESSFDDAVQRAVAEAAKSLRELRWFEVTDTRGQVENGKIAHWQVTVRIGFTIEDSLVDS